MACPTSDTLDRTFDRPCSTALAPSRASLTRAVVVESAMVVSFRQELAIELIRPDMQNDALHSEDFAVDSAQAAFLARSEPHDTQIGDDGFVVQADAMT